ncbi:MAG: hypothetical protein QGH73_17130 [Rhodospirillales bacterium]|jgi:hypothetical protein|nr:hypothetical protein [Rhodospirillales bacterium]
MIAEMVTLKLSKEFSRDAALADARTTFEHWTDFPGLVRKHFLYGGDGCLYGFYIWESREASDRGHNEDWRQNVIARTGNPPQSQYFDVMATVDNQRGVVEEFGAPAEAAE